MSLGGPVPLATARRRLDSQLPAISRFNASRSMTSTPP
jgi:hypothetical protein